jgi:carbamoyltransferase
MNIVGINISHDTSVCLMQDKKIIFYLEEERLCKIKSYMIRDLPVKKIKTLDKIKNFISKIDYLIITTFKSDDALLDIKIAEDIVNQIIKIGLKLDKITLNLEDHHLIHAHNSFYLSGFESAAVVITDGSGSYSSLFPDENGLHYREIESVYKFNNNQYKMLYKHYSSFGTTRNSEKFFYRTMDNNKIVLSNSLGCGQLFTEVSIGILNFKEHESGKTMGMSSYGVLDNDKTEWFKEYENNVLFDYDFFDTLLKSKIYQSASFQEQANYTKKLQHETKEYTICLIQKAIDLSDSNNVVLSGGYFQNCVNNYAYLKAFPNINFYVDPICYDGGTAIGACLYVWHHVLGNPNTLQTFNNLYLGPE